jgi:hypothetical protein
MKSEVSTSMYTITLPWDGSVDSLHSSDCRSEGYPDELMF